jgi:hypothetical protein
MSDDNEKDVKREDPLVSLIQEVAASEHVNPVSLSAYADSLAEPGKGELTPPAELLVRMHIDLCKVCRERLDVMLARRATEDSQDVVHYQYSAPEQPMRKPRLVFRRLSFAVAGMATVTILAVVMLQAVGRKGVAGSGREMVVLDVSYPASAEQDLPALLGAEPQSRAYSYVRGNRLDAKQQSELRVAFPRDGENVLNRSVEFRFVAPAGKRMQLVVQPVFGTKSIRIDLKRGASKCNAVLTQGTDYIWHVENPARGDDRSDTMSFRVVSLAEIQRLKEQDARSRLRGPFHHAAFLWENQLLSSWEERTKQNLLLDNVNWGPEDRKRVEQLRHGLAEFERGEPLW